MSMNLSDIAILNINGVHCHCIVTGISKSQAVNLLQKADLNEKKRNIIKYKKFIFKYKNGSRNFNVW